MTVKLLKKHLGGSVRFVLNNNQFSLGQCLPVRKSYLKHIFKNSIKSTKWLIYSVYLNAMKRNNLHRRFLAHGSCKYIFKIMIYVFVR